PHPVRLLQPFRPGAVRGDSVCPASPRSGPQPVAKETVMYARVATFQNDPSRIDASAERVQAIIDAPDLPDAMKQARFMLLADRKSGKTLGVALFESEEAMMAADAVMNAGAGEAGSRSGVEFFEVTVHNLSG